MEVTIMNKKYYTVFLLFSVAILFFSACETTPIRQAPLPGESIAHFPKMMVGDSWVTKGPSHKYVSDIHHSKVTEVKEDGSFVIEVKAEKAGLRYYLYYNNKYQAVKVIGSTGKTKKISEVCQKLSFPLFVGKKWKDQYYSKSITGVKYEYTNEYTVIKYETITTKAGSFKAFKIRQWNSSIEIGPIGHWAYWYSPKLKNIIKSSSKYHTNIELLSYKLAKGE